ncbi:MAG: DUF366 family protein [Proteobacteria bacterium]|jgi:uncharacterized protein|nr:DUF366 family protein [Pseudomonadota bacterium]NBY20077.1 DUF366 family protein [bacterium]
MDSLSIQYLDSSIAYTGKELKPHWIYENTGLLGNSLTAFQGPCEVSLAHMVDLEDVKRKAPIYSLDMVHFLGEFFIDSLDHGILLQHLLVATAYGWLWEQGIRDLSRKGNDIYYRSRKLSVSIATKSPVSVLIHFGINVKTEGTPIPTSGLNELKIEPKAFAQGCLETFLRDYNIWRLARFKVSPR